MGQKINTAILGFGLSGKVFHAPFIHTHPGFHLSTILQRHSNSAKEIYPYVNIVKDIDEIIRDENIDLIVIGTPNTTHFDFAKMAIEAGKHVVVEKPFTNTTDEADKLIELSKLFNKKIFVYHNRRWDGDFHTIKNLLKKKQLGKPVEYEAHFDRFSPVLKTNSWRDIDQPGGGLVYDLGSHLIDQAMQLFGKPERIFADIRSQRPGSKVDDYFDISLFYQSLKVILKAGMMVRARLPRYIIHGDKRSFVKFGIDPQEEALKNGQMPVGNFWGEESIENYGQIIIEENGSEIYKTIETRPGCYQEFYNNVYDVIINDAEQAVKPEEARDVIFLIEKAFESKRLGKVMNIDENL